MTKDYLQKSVFRAFLRSAVAGTATAISGVIMLATIFSAYGGCFDPATLPIAALASMILPGLLIAGAVMIVIDLLINSRIALMIVAAWIVSLPPLLIFFPLNFSDPKLTPEEESRSFTFLTYNVQHFIPYRTAPATEVNGTVEYILSVDADVVNLQEAELLKPNPATKFTRAQLDSLLERYPYHLTDNNQQFTVLSKFPVEYVDTTIPRRSHPCLTAVYRLDIHGTPVTLYNVHLKSIGLDSDDKELFREIPSKIRHDTEIRSEIREVKSQLISKLSQSFRVRSVEAHWLRQMIDSIGGNTIVAGDFNDIPGCYAERIIMDGDLHDAYAENAFGPRITYHDNRFYFRIDHILYGGDLRSVTIRRDTTPWSDHYPLFTRFVIN